MKSSRQENKSLTQMEQRTYLGKPEYSFPAGIDEGNDALALLRDWEQRLDALVALPLPIDETLQDDIAAYCRWLSYVFSHRPDKRWSLLANRTMPMDAVTDFVKRHTFIALVTLIYVKRTLPQLADTINGLGNTINDVSLKMVLGRCESSRLVGLMGNGYDTYTSMCEFVRYLASGGGIAYWCENQSQYAVLVDKLLTLHDDLRENPERWCGKQAGYSVISRQERAQCLIDLNPIGAMLDDNAAEAAADS